MVEVLISGAVAEVRLSRPDKHNALDMGMFQGIREAQEEIRRQPAVRAVVLSGDGPSFSSGLDLGAVASGGLDFEALWARDDATGENLAQEVACGWRRVGPPVIAAVHGACFGGGLQIALGADIRLAAADARLSIMEIRLGLVPDMGITMTLPPLVGLDVAKELAFTGRIVDGEEALRLGLVTRLAPAPREAALELAEDLAGHSPEAIRSAKQLFDRAWAGPGASGLEEETRRVRELVGSPDQFKAAAAARADGRG